MEESDSIAHNEMLSLLRKRLKFYKNYGENCGEWHPYEKKKLWSSLSIVSKFEVNKSSYFWTVHKATQAGYASARTSRQLVQSHTKGTI